MIIGLFLVNSNFVLKTYREAILCDTSVRNIEFRVIWAFYLFKSILIKLDKKTKCAQEHWTWVYFFIVETDNGFLNVQYIIYPQSNILE